MRLNKKTYFIAILASILTVACIKDLPIVPEEIPLLQVPDHFGEIQIPATNPITQEKIDLGKKLFYDPILSLDSTVSCASCHPADNAFADPRPFSIGVYEREGFFPEEKRNAPALFNLGYARALFWDGAVSAKEGAYDEIEIQAVKPIENFFEMGHNFETLTPKLNNHPLYPTLFKEAFGVDTIRDLHIVQAIAHFERTLLSYGSKYDEFVESGFDSTMLTPAEKRGLILFFDEREGRNHPECFHCHGGFNFDDQGQIFRSNGLETNDPGSSRVPGMGPTVKFKVPSLRNLSYTAPYMHDGRFETLDDVLDFYQHINDEENLPLPVDSDRLMRTVGFTDEEKADLKAFLMTLNDPSFVNNPDFRPDQE
jgi:cytochrome c peroxidase